MSEAELLQMYAGYLNQRGYKSYRIPESSVETPDLIINKDKMVILNEFKAPFLIANEDAAPFVYKFKTTLLKLRRNISKSAKQLESYDPEHALVWAVTFASTHSQLNWNSLKDAIAGRIINHDGSTLTDLTESPAYKNTKERIKNPDLFIWLQVNSKNQIFQVSVFLNSSSKHHKNAILIANDFNRARVSAFDNIPIIISL